MGGFVIQLFMNGYGKPKRVYLIGFFCDFGSGDGGFCRFLLATQSTDQQQEQ